MSLNSCNTNTNSIIATSIFETQSKWTIPPTYTFYPTYTNQPTKVVEITRIIVVTETSTPTLTSTPILISGTGGIYAYTNKTAIEESYFDLDKGIIDDSKASDIVFTMWCGSDCFPSLEFYYGAIGFIYGEEEPRQEDCKGKMHSEKFQISSDYICVLTNKDNISIIKIYSLKMKTNKWELLFTYKTWVH